MKFVSSFFIGIGASYLILLFYAALSSNLGFDLPDNLLTHYLVILGCVFSATIFHHFKKLLTSKEE